MHEWEILAAAALGLALAGAVLAALLPVRLTAQAEVGAGTAASFSGLLSVGPLGVGAASLSATRARFTLDLFDRRLYSFEAALPRKLRGESGGFSLSGTRETLETVLGAARAYDRRIGMWESLGFALRERRRVVIEDLAGRVRYGFEEYEKTGELSGYLWALRGMLGPAFNLHHEPDWSGKNVLAGAVRVKLRACPVLLAADAALFVFARFRVRAKLQGAPARA